MNIKTLAKQAVQQQDYRLAARIIAELEDKFLFELASGLEGLKKTSKMWKPIDAYEAKAKRQLVAATSVVKNLLSTLQRMVGGFELYTENAKSISNHMMGILNRLEDVNDMFMQLDEDYVINTLLPVYEVFEDAWLHIKYAPSLLKRVTRVM